MTPRSRHHPRSYGSPFSATTRGFFAFPATYLSLSHPSTRNPLRLSLVPRLRLRTERTPPPEYPLRKVFVVAHSVQRFGLITSTPVAPRTLPKPRPRVHFVPNQNLIVTDTPIFDSPSELSGTAPLHFRQRDECYLGPLFAYLKSLYFLQLV